MAIGSPVPSPARSPQVTAPDPRRDRWTAVLLLTAAAVTLGYAVQLAGGRYTPRALALAVLAAALVAVALLGRERPAHEALARRWYVPVVLGALALQLAQLYTAVPGVYMRVTSIGDLEQYFVLLAVAAVLAASGAAERPAVRRWRVPLLIAVYVMIGIFVIRNSPSPHIDVFPIHQESIAALLDGVNPYAITFHDIYGGTSPYFAPGVVKDGRIQHGYPYPPLSLLLAVPGYVVAGDHRYSHLAAVAVAAACMGVARRGVVPAMAVSIFLLTPRGFQVIEDSWTEPFVAMLLALTVLAACRRSRWLPYALGLFFAVKQYTVIFLPATILLWPALGIASWRAAVAPYAKALAVAAAVTLPLVLWNPAAFMWSTVKIFQTTPFREDALSLSAALSRMGWRPPGMVGFLAVLPVYYLLWRFAPRTPSGFAAAVALLAIVFFAFSKQAFLNQYFFIIAACCTAAGTAQVPSGEAEALQATPA